MNGRIDQSVSGPCNLVIASIMDLPKDQDDKDGSKGDLNNEGLGEPLKNDVKSADTGNLGRLTSSSISGSAESGFNGVENEISWFAKDPSKAYYEKISLVWAPLSMFLLLVVLLGTPLHRLCGRNSYLAISLFGCVPGFAIPLLRPCKADLDRPILERFWVKGTIWISIFGFYGNYFWTHYFYTLLGAEYKFDSYRFNDVPVVTYICTFFYFTFYFSFVNVVLRRIAYMTSDFPPFGRSALWIFSIAALSYGTAIFEAISIQHFPLYTYKQRDLFLFIGSVVYGLYFIVGFPMFFSLDEEYDDTKDNIEHVPGEKNKTSRVSLAQVTLNVFAACAIVTLLLDLWRLFLGSIYDLGSSSSVQLPFIYQGSYASTPAHCSLSQSPTASASIPPVPTIETIYVEQPVTIDACVKVAKGWAQSKVLEVQKLFNK